MPEHRLHAAGIFVNYIYSRKKWICSRNSHAETHMREPFPTNVPHHNSTNSQTVSTRQFETSTHSLREFRYLPTALETMTTDKILFLRLPFIIYFLWPCIYQTNIMQKTPNEDALPCVYQLAGTMGVLHHTGLESSSAFASGSSPPATSSTFSVLSCSFVHDRTGTEMLS